MSNAAIYARVSSARQKEQETIGSQTAALRAHAEQLGLDVPAQWMFCDDGHSGATLVRPALEKLRDLVAQVPVEVVLVYSPDRLARKYAYQALLIEEFAKAGSSVVFVKGPSSDSPEDALLVQFQGMIAEYERAQIIERTRRGKAHRARQGTVNVLSGAPFGYRYVRKNEHVDACYEVVAYEAAIVAELFRRYVEDGVAIADLTRWLTTTGVATRTGKARWDRSVVWGMLRNPAYAGRACFGKTMRTADQPGLNRTARVCDNKPVRTDYLDSLVWQHITDLLADPALIRAEIDRRLDQLRTADPTTAQQHRLEQALAKASASITRLIKAYQEDLISLDELRERVPALRARETSLSGQLEAVAAQLVDREAYLKLAENLEGFLTRLRDNAATATVPERQRVLRLLVKDVLIGPERIIVRHSIPTGGTAAPRPNITDRDDDQEPAQRSPLRWRSLIATTGRIRWSRSSPRSSGR